MWLAREGLRERPEGKDHSRGKMRQQTPEGWNKSVPHPCASPAQPKPGISSTFLNHSLNACLGQQQRKSEVAQSPHLQVSQRKPCSSQIPSTNPLGAALCHPGGLAPSRRCPGSKPNITRMILQSSEPGDIQKLQSGESRDCPALECCRSLSRASPELCNPTLPAIKSLLQAKTGTWGRRSKEFLHLQPSQLHEAV